MFFVIFYQNRVDFDKYLISIWAIKGGGMEAIKSLEKLVEYVKSQEKKTIIVACGHDPHTIGATSRAAKENLVSVVLVGNKEKMEVVAEKEQIDLSVFQIIDEKDDYKAGAIARDMVVAKEGDVLMKGLIGSDVYMRLILNKEKGLLPKKGVLSHLAVMEVPTYPKLLFVSDVAVIPSPDLFQKIAMLKYDIKTAHRFGIETPKAAIIAATEKVSDKMPATMDAAVISKMADRGQIKGAIVDGPLALDIAVSKEACEIKGINSPAGGEADILIFPNIESGNVFFKSLTKFAGGELAGVVTGTTAPCILTSRSDSENSKFYSIALAAIMAGEWQ